MTEKIINFRVDEGLKKAFERVAAEADMTSSQLLRAFMRETVESYMKQNAQQSLLEPINKSVKVKAKPKKKSALPDAWRAK